MLIQSEEFYLIFVFYLNVQYIEQTLRIYILLHIKRLLHALFCLLLKSAKALCILKWIIMEMSKIVQCILKFQATIFNAMTSFEYQLDRNLRKPVNQKHIPSQQKRAKPHTVKLVYNDHLGDDVSVVVIDKWSL